MKLPRKGRGWIDSPNFCFPIFNFYLDIMIPSTTHIYRKITYKVPKNFIDVKKIVSQITTNKFTKENVHGFTLFRINTKENVHRFT